MMISFIKGKKAVQTYLTLREKWPLRTLRTLINHIILESWIKFH